MNRSTDLVALANEVQRQVKSRRDFVAPAPAITMTVESTPGENPVHGLQVGDHRFGIKPWAHKQMSQHLGIPASYYDRLRMGEPQLLTQNVNTLLAHNFEKGEPVKRMVRTLDGSVRALVSPKFFCLDNYDLMEHLLPTVKEVNGQVMNCQLTERHLYLTITDPALRMLVPGSRRVGDIVEGGAIIGNSEIGDGSLFVKGYLNYLTCLNGAVREDGRFKRHHLGRSIDIDEDVRELLSNEAQRADARAIFLKLRDVFKAMFDRARFEAYIRKVGSTTQDIFDVERMDKVIDLTVRELDLPEPSKQGILTALIKGGDFSRYGLMNAITFMAHEEEDAEQAIAFERAGGQVVELAAGKWKRISEGREATREEAREEAAA